MTTATAIAAISGAPSASSMPGERASRLATRLEAGALALATLAQGLTEAE